MRHAWIKGLALLVAVPGGGDDEQGLALLAQGKFAEAAAAFRAAIAAEGPSAERAYNLALALWRAGDADAAETAAEQAATLSDGALNPLRDGLLGNLRFAAAEAKQQAQDLQGALELARQAHGHYLRGALARPGQAELGRNLERAQQLVADLEKQIEEQEKQQQEEQEKDQEKEQEKQDEQQKDEQQKSEEEKSEEEKSEQEKSEPKPGEQPSEPPGEPQPEEPPPKPGEQPQPPEEKPQEEQPPEQQQAPAPGEQAAGRELTPEEKKRLLDKLDELEKLRLQLRAQQKAQRPVVEKDW